MKRYINEHTGLVDFRVEVTSPPRHGWRWLVLLVGLIVLIDVAMAHWLRVGVR
jgi:hypothetical protein